MCIRDRIAGKRTKAAKAPKEQRGVSLLIDIENSIKAQESRGYEPVSYTHLQNADRRKGIIKSICMICKFIYVAGITRWRVMAFFDSNPLWHRKMDMTIPPQYRHILEKGKF